jgi:hypothetical protein
MFDFAAALRPVLPPDAAAWLEQASASAEQLPVLLPQLARRIGRKPLVETETRIEHEGLHFDLSAWRACDAAAAQLIARAQPDSEQLVDLYRHGDMEEKAAVLRAVQLMPIGPATLELLGEVQRTNTALHYEAGALDSDLIVRALREGGDDSGFTRADFANLVLKCAFLDMPAGRIFGVFDEATAELSAMLRDFATEREAAGRSVWVDTYHFLGRALCPGALARCSVGSSTAMTPCVMPRRSGSPRAGTGRSRILRRSGWAASPSRRSGGCSSSWRADRRGPLARLRARLR